MSPTNALTNKVWRVCHLLRGAMPRFGDYLEQLTSLISLKMAPEYTQPTYRRGLGIANGCDWPSLASKTGEIATGLENG